MIKHQGGKALSTSRRTFLRAASGAGLVLATGIRSRPARAATEKILFQLDWIAYGRHAPYYAALENGFYAEKGLEVTIAQGRSTIQGIRTLVAGQSQFIFQDIAVMMSVRAEEGSKIRALAGSMPSAQLAMEQKLYNTVSVQEPFEPGLNSNTVPSAFLPVPPSSVVPYKLPPLSKIS